MTRRPAPPKPPQTGLPAALAATLSKGDDDMKKRRDTKPTDWVHIRTAAHAIFAGRDPARLKNVPDIAETLAHTLTFASLSLCQGDPLRAGVLVKEAIVPLVDIMLADYAAFDKATERMQ